jgi:hypothetical protein
MSTELLLRHGYTLADLHDTARLAVHTAGTMASDWHERYDTAYSAIAEHLYAAEHWPARHDLVRVGQLAIYSVVTSDRHHHGYYRHKTIGNAAGPCSSPAFLTFWWDASGNTGSCESVVVERLALRQIFNLLNSRQREVLMALAIYEDYQAAAAALGLPQSTYKSYISKARKMFFALWHEGEEPSRIWGCDRRAGATASTRRAGGTHAAMAAIRRRREFRP